MRVTPVGRTFARHLTACCAPALALSIFWGTPLNAEVTESSFIQNQFGFAVGPELSFTPQPGGSKETHYVASKIPGARSEVGLNYTATLQNGGFFFLHDNYCVGSCATFSQTVITFTLHNNGDSPVNLRFDSQITPGHLAQIFGSAPMDGSFDFTVRQNPVALAPSTNAAVTPPLYQATGTINSDGINLSTGSLTFNGLHTTTDPNGRWKVVDWSTTNLSVPLATLASGATTQVTYTATYQVSAGAECTNVRNCEGLQVVFGDPRNSGSVSGPVDGFAPSAGDDAIYPVIGRDYDPHFITAQFVPVGSPLPGTPPVLGPFNYGPLFAPRADVPEPAIWAMMIGGFGMIGGAMRRRKAGSAALENASMRAV